MSNLELSHVYKVYPNGVKAVNDFSMNIQDKEFIVFVGPSGCGKSTTLRMIAGLEEITSGEIKIDDLIVNDAEPKERDIAMVFQNYALYPHMTVYKNMAFGLKLRHMPKAEIDRRVREAAEILGITDYLDRKPKAMSGGQRQRVALGRAIVREPKVFLLDEPLSNLDAKLRATMRSEISKLHHKLQTTFIYVTHDQVEAMTMGTRIVVMKDGFVQQIDTPRNLYRFPCNKFVAGFIGTPQMNFFKVTLLKTGESVEMNFIDAPIKFKVPMDLFSHVDPSYLDGVKNVTLGIRCEHISPDPKKYPYKAKVKVSHTEELGVDSQIYADFNLDRDDILSESSSETKVLLKAPTGINVEMDQIIEVSFGLEHMQLFDSESEESINPRLPKFVNVIAKSDKKAIKAFGVSFPLPPAINLEKGEYAMQIPTEAITLGSQVTGIVNRIDQTTDKNIYTLKIGKNYLFVTDNLDSKVKVDDEVSVDIDLKKCSFKNETVEVSALNEDNVLVGEVIKNFIIANHINEKGKQFSRKEAYCSIKMGDAELLTSRSLGFKLINLKDNKIFKDTVEFHFSPYSVVMSESGIKCTLREIHDYGKELFAVVAVGEKDIIVKINNAEEANLPCININLDETHAYDIKSGIRLI